MYSDPDYPFIPRTPEQLRDDMREKRKQMNESVQGELLTVTHHMRYRRFDKNLPALHRDNPRNGGYDLFARLEEPAILSPGDVMRIPLNVATEIPVGAVGLLFQRSSTFKKWGIKLTNNVGLIDSIFDGDGDEWAGEFRNETGRPVKIQPGDKICQAVFFETLPLVLEEVDELGNADRGGFGTTFDNSKEIE